MLRHGKLTCSVSEELHLAIAEHLVKLGLCPEESLELSRIYRNVKVAMANSSLCKPPVAVDIPILGAASQVDETKLPEHLPPNKQEIKDRLIEIGATPEQIMLLVEICDNANEALANILGEDFEGGKPGGFNFNADKIEQGESRFVERKGQEEKCPICYEIYEHGDKLKTLPCFHKYPTDCVKSWFEDGKKTCPVCLVKVKYT